VSFDTLSERCTYWLISSTRSVLVNSSFTLARSWLSTASWRAAICSQLLAMYRKRNINTHIHAHYTLKMCKQIHLLNIWEFVYLSVAYLLNATSDDVEIWQADAHRPCAGHVLGFMPGVVVTKIITFSKMRCGDLRSVGATAGSRLQQRAGPLQCRSRRVAIWLAPACTNVGRWPKRAGCV